MRQEQAPVRLWVRLKNGESQVDAFWWALAALTGWLLLLLIRRKSFERRRWQDADEPQPSR